MEILKKKENQLTFKTKTDISLVNAIRRYINHILIFAIEDVEISKNDSPLYDETIAHRLGLIPLKRKKSINESKEKLTLDVKKEGGVYSGDLKGDVEVVYGKIPITVLDKGQEIKLVGKGKFGKGNEHAKFCPGIMFYRNVRQINLDKILLEEIKIACPHNKIIEKDNKIIILDDQEKEILDVCENTSKSKNKEIEVKNEDELIVDLESFGQIKIENMIKESSEELKKDLLSIKKALK